jgi:crotonobetainyl-CoA:carnitine CoA-transferase CaiB-like acyl-CoA transferase
LTQRNHQQTATTSAPEQPQGPCAGLRVLDIGQLVAAPLAATLLADFGADVVKVERPGSGDPLRALGPHKDAVSLWHKVNARNKRNIALDLKCTEDRRTFLRFVEVADVVVANFTPGVLERLELTYEHLRAVNPRLVMLEVTGFGLDGPYRSKRGFGRSGEAFGGMTFVTGSPDGPPVSSAIPIADCTSGILGAFAVMAAIYERDRYSGEGQHIDLALYETIFRMMEGMAIGYDQLGLVMQRMGSQNVYAFPVGTWPTGDGQWASFTVSTEPMAKRFFDAIGRPDLADDPKFSTNAARVANRDELDAIVAEWLRARTLDEIIAIFDAHDLAICPIMSVDKIFEDPQYAARQNLVELDDEELGRVRMQNVVPRFSRTPGKVRMAGRMPDADRDTVLRDWVGT